MSELQNYRDRFDRDGYVVVPDFLKPAELVELRGMIDSVLDNQLQPDCGGAEKFSFQYEAKVRDDPAVAHRDKVRVVFHLAHTHSYFWSMVTNPRLLDLVESIIGPNPLFYTDQTFMKPAHHGSEIPWHQDSAYWPNVEPRLLSVWLAIDDVTIENGCVRFVPGTHRQAIPHDEVEANTVQRFRTNYDYVDASKEVPVELKAGSLSLHHSLALHRSLPNTSDHARRGMVMIFMPADIKFIKPWDFKYGFKPVRERQAAEI